MILPYMVPQAISAVMSYAASYERPFIGSESFSHSADPLILFACDAAHLAKKIQWCFEGHEQELVQHARRYKRENSWARSAAILAGRYEQVLGATLRDKPGPGGSERN